MATEPSSARPPGAPRDKVRIEIAFQGENHAHEVTTDVFQRSIEVIMRGDQVKWRMDVVKITMSAAAAKDAMRETIGMLDPEDQWEIIRPLAEDLERRGVFRPT